MSNKRASDLFFLLFSPTFCSLLSASALAFFLSISLFFCA